MKTYHTFSSEETKNLGARFAREALKKINTRKSAAIFALKGELGAGKTTFVQGFFKGLGIGKRTLSPTFIIMRRHALGKKRNVFHIDAYRLKKAEDLRALDFGNIAADPRNIVLVEWADRIKKILPKGVVWLEFKYGKATREHERSIMIKQ